MLKVDLKNGRDYGVFIGTGVVDELIAELSGRKYAVISDSNVAKLHGEDFVKKLREAGVECELISFEAGEASKNWTMAGELGRKMLRKGYSRSDAVIALGGGVTGDLAGFVASVFMRGVDVIQVPTSLLAMTDAAIGGKTGVNCEEGKNLLGTFHQPNGVYVDVNFLKTLSKEEMRCGYAEIVKHGIIGDEELFEIIEGAAVEDLFGDMDLMVRILERSCGVKVGIVSRDERESGLRMKLNLGHTLGHAVEREMNYGISHGVAVAIGTMKVCEVAVEKGMMEASEAERVKKVLMKLGLNVEVPEGLEAVALVEAMGGDKKVRSGVINFVVPVKIGEVVVTDEVRAEDFLKVI